MASESEPIKFLSIDKIEDDVIGFAESSVKPFIDWTFYMGNNK